MTRTFAKYFYPRSANVYRFLLMRIDSGTLKRVHGINEQITVQDYLAAIRFYHAMSGE
jgi:carboxypeptidase PM20D1